MILKCLWNACDFFHSLWKFKTHHGVRKVKFMWNSTIIKSLCFADDCHTFQNFFLQHNFQIANFQYLWRRFLILEEKFSSRTQSCVHYYTFLNKTSHSHRWRILKSKLNALFPARHKIYMYRWNFFKQQITKKWNSVTYFCNTLHSIYRKFLFLS